MTPMTSNVPEKILEMMREKTLLRRLGETKDVDIHICILLQMRQTLLMEQYYAWMVD
jgi:hypothetical protein